MQVTMINKKIKPRKHEEVRYKIISKHVIGKNIKLLDVGCRDGILSHYLDSSIEYYGIDINPETELAQKVDVTKDKFPFEPNFFDYVVITEVLEHLDNQHHCLTETYRVLKTKGKLIGTVPNGLDIHKVLLGLFNRDYGSEDHFVCFGLNELKSLLTANKFKVVELHPFCFRLPKIEIDMRIMEKLFPKFCVYIY